MFCYISKTINLIRFFAPYMMYAPDTLCSYDERKIIHIYIYIYIYIYNDDR